MYFRRRKCHAGSHSSGSAAGHLSRIEGKTGTRPAPLLIPTDDKSDGIMREPGEALSFGPGMRVASRGRFKSLVMNEIKFPLCKACRQSVNRSREILRELQKNVKRRNPKPWSKKRFAAKRNPNHQIQAVRPSHFKENVGLWLICIGLHWPACNFAEFISTAEPDTTDV